MRSTLNERGRSTIVTPDEKLLAALKDWRKRTAYRLGLPPYIIVTDLTLNLIALEKPKDKRELLKIKGIAENKADKYGKDIVKIVNEHIKKPEGK
jgi:superfamily II DNA helicase RecQ